MAEDQQNYPPGTAAFPLSYAQQRLWFLDQWHPDSHFYNVYGAVRLVGEMDESVLEQALNALIERHESLRTRFGIVQGEPTQIVDPAADLQLQKADLRCFPKIEEREAEARRVLYEEVRRSFDLRRGPLLRFLLLRLEEQNRILLLNAHHIVSDGWSMEVLVRELTTVYEAFRQGKPFPLAPLPIQYVDFACWQRQWLQGDVLQQQLDYWRKKLENAPAMLNLPADHPRPAVQKFAGATRRRVLPAQLQDNLAKLCSDADVTMFMALLAAFKILLRYYTSQEDIVVGTHVANRSRIETETVIGFFVNQLVLRTDLSGDGNFLELLARVKETALQAYEHQDLPFDVLVAELKPERSMGWSPLYQVLFTFQNLNILSFTLPSLVVSPVEITADVARFDLVVRVVEQDGKMTQSIEYDSGLFEESTIDRMMEQYQALLEYLVSNREVRGMAIRQWLEESEARYRKAVNQQLRQISFDKLKHIRRRELASSQGQAK